MDNQINNNNNNNNNKIISNIIKFYFLNDNNNNNNNDTYEENNELILFSWDSNNNDRLNLQLVCKEWCFITRSFCESLSLSKSNIIPLFFKIDNFINLKHIEMLGVDKIPDIVTKVLCNILSVDHYNNYNNKNQINKLNKLKSIDLSLSNLSYFHFKFILESLNFNNSIEDLNFEGNDLGDQSIQDLSNLLLIKNNIKFLDLSSCNSLNGLNYIGMTLSKNNSIQSLNWSKNYSNKSIINLCEGLKWNKSLTTLSLSECGIDEFGALCLGEVLKYNNSITSIDLSYNNISDNGAIYLATQTINNPSIKYINLSFNSISVSGIEKVSNILQSKSYLIQPN